MYLLHFVSSRLVLTFWLYGQKKIKIQSRWCLKIIASDCRNTCQGVSSGMSNVWGSPGKWRLHCSPTLSACQGRKQYCLDTNMWTASGSSPVVPIKEKPVHPLQLVLPELVTVLVLARLLKLLPRVGSRPLLGQEDKRNGDGKGGQPQTLCKGHLQTVALRLSGSCSNFQISINSHL